MKIRLKKRFTLTQAAICSIVGVIGGIYIWKPYFEGGKAPAIENSAGRNLEAPNPSKSLKFE